MLRISKPVLLAFVATTLSGACLHFVYALFPNPVFALFSPVNESLWEHLKILFWPGLMAALCLRRRADAGGLAARLLALLLAGAVMLVVGYVYHIPLGGDALSFDICLYVLVMAMAFVLPGWFSGRISRRGRDAVYFLTLVTGVAILLFTFLPPGFLLFADLSGGVPRSGPPC